MEKTIKMKNLEKWLKTKGYTWKWYNAQGGGHLMIINTDYAGPYPKKETFRQISEIEKTAERRNLKTKPVGFYTGVLVTE